MLKLLHRFTKACDGLAAVEFAFIAPILILVFFATIELSEALDCRARVAAATSTGADLVAQETKVSTSDMNNIFSALNAIIYPYASGSARIVISSIVDNGSGVDKVVWSASQNATARTVGTTVSLPTGLITSGSGNGVILAEITYAYTSPIMVFLTGTLSMTNSFYAKPRLSATVTHT